jgi:hypothetical protein
LLKDAQDARKRNRGEEVFEVGVEDDGAVDVLGGVRHRAAAFDEAVGGGVGGDLVQDVAEDPLVGGGEFLVRGEEVADAAGALGNGEADVVGRGGGFGVEGEPAERRYV